MPQQFSVAEICRIIEAKIKGTPELQDVWIRGEITSYQKHASSGHIYMTLSDMSQKAANPRSTIRCTYFRFAQTPLDFELKAGLEVELFGSMGIYAPQSTYSLTVRRVQKVGAGDILAKLQQIRERLLKDGLIKTPETRREIPLLPKRVGIVTGAGTAAYRDMLKQVQERYPNAEIVLAPAQVQGEAAAASIVALDDPTPGNLAKAVEEAVARAEPDIGAARPLVALTPLPLPGPIADAAEIAGLLRQAAL